MKNLRIPLIFVCFICIVYTSCEKEENSPDLITNHTNTSKTKNKNEKALAPFGTKLITCTIKVNGEEPVKGFACWLKRSNIPCGENKAHKCKTKSQLPQLLQQHLSFDEIEDWHNGTFFQDNAEFVTLHYDFYVALYQENILGAHPDELLANYSE